MLWVGTHGGGLNRFDPRTEMFIAYRHREGDPTSLSDDGVYALHQACDGTLWVNTKTALHKLVPSPLAQEPSLPSNTGPGTATPAVAFTAYPHDDLEDVQLGALQETTGGMLWMGTGGGGLNRFDPTTGTFTAYRRREGDPTSLSHDWVYALHTARDGALWVGVPLVTVQDCTAGPGSSSLSDFEHEKSRI